MQATDKFDAMGKTELRAACKEAGVKNYGKMNNDGMRAALIAAEAAANTTAETEAEEEDEIPAPAPTGMFAQMLGLTPVPAPANVGNVTRVVDGKRVEDKPKTKSESRTSTDKPAVPIVPRVSRKGYKIEKERPVQNGVKRPSSGTVCGAVWAAFDANPAIKAGELAALADANGWNPNNASIEFYAWRRFNGIKGRAAK